jgi:hypothetical protein
MKSIWNWVINNPNRTMFLIPILLVAGISISHVVTWYDIANPINWAIYLSIAIEVGAMTALVAATNKIKGGVWFMFGLITLIQMIGNIFFSFKEIDENGELFKSWVELTGPVWELFGTEQTDIVGLKRWLAFLEGGLLPIISLTSLHFFVKYEGQNSPKEEVVSPKEEELEIKTIEVVEEDSPKEEVVSPKEDDGDISEWDVTLMDGLIEEPYEVENKTEEIPSDESVIELSDKDMELFVNTIENNDDPNEVLKNALEKYKQSKGDSNQINKMGKSNIKRID